MPERNGNLLTYTIYDHPRDYPYGFTMTEWEITRTGPVAVATSHADTLEAARRLIPPGLICLVRSPDDDPVIVETWL